jgi:hypothetical protein
MGSICLKKRDIVKIDSWSVQGFLDKLAEYCRATYNPPQKLDVDEQCFDFKSRFIGKLYNASKPAKYHLKNFAMNCALTGFMCNFFMYCGKNEQLAEEYANYSATEYPVMRLTNHQKYKGKNHVMGTDNWYTSIQLAVDLLAIGIYLISFLECCDG